MGVIVHVADDLPGLPLANVLLSSVCELVSEKTSDTAFRAVLEVAAVYQYIDLWKCTPSQREEFALGLEELHRRAREREGAYPDLLTGLLWRASEIRKTLSEGEAS